MSEFRAQRLRLLLLAGLAVPAAMALVGFLLAYLLRREVLDLMHVPSLRAVGIGLATGMLSMGLVYLLYKSNKRIERALRETGVRVGEDALRMAGTPVMLVIVTMAGMGEEILFRGGLQPTIGLIAAALLFGLSHGGWRKEMWAYAVVASVSGTLFGLTYRLTGDLWIPIIAHMLHNVAATLVMVRNVHETDGLFPFEPEPWATEPAHYRSDDVFDAADDDAVEDLEDGELGKSLPAETDGPPDGADHGDPPRGSS